MRRWLPEVELELVLREFLGIAKGVDVVDGIEDPDQERTALSSVYLWGNFQGMALLVVDAVVSNKWFFFLPPPLILGAGPLRPILSTSALPPVDRSPPVLIIPLPTAVPHPIYYIISS